MKRALLDIFGGKMKQYITSTAVGYEESTTQSMWEIDLDAHKLHSLDESFKDYLRSEKVEGDTRADLGRPSGLYDRDMGITFTHLAPVLQLYLKRIHYDHQTRSLIKSNTYFEYPEEFDASPYLSPDTDRSEPWTYRLVGVTVHSGNMSGGQYYMFRRPTKDGPFYKFNDDTVCRATLREVMNDNFGGVSSRLTSSHVGFDRGDFARQERSRNAYMLVYIRKSRLDEILVEVKEEDVPEHISMHPHFFSFISYAKAGSNANFFYRTSNGPGTYRINKLRGGSTEILFARTHSILKIFYFININF